MLWSFLLILQRTTLHQPTVNFEVKSMLFQLSYRSNTDYIFRLRGGCNLRSRIMNGLLKAKLMWLWMKLAFDNIQSQRQIFQVDISNKTNEMFDRNEIGLKAKLTVVYLTY